MNPAVVIGAVYLGQLVLKAGLALRCRVGERPAHDVNLERVTVVQPIMSGDELLREILVTNLHELRGAAFMWIADSADVEAQDLAKQLQKEFPAVPIQLLVTGEPPSGVNPKLWKQIAAEPHVRTELLAIVDDDTRVPRTSLEMLVTRLDAGAEIATGLPCYVPARGRWSELVAEFVNSAAILTYLPAAACTEPRSINGMCYALRTDYVRRHRLFQNASRAITDDLAVAKEVHRAGGRIAQTSRPQFISTTVTSGTHFRRLMHRWFVAIRILAQCEKPAIQAAILLTYGAPPLLLAAMCVLAAVTPATSLVPLLIVLGGRMLLLGGLNRIIIGRWRHAPLASVLMELAQPGFLTAACLCPTVYWRHRRIRVRAYDNFEYLQP